LIQFHHATSELAINDRVRPRLTNSRAETSSAHGSAGGIVLEDALAAVSRKMHVLQLNAVHCAFIVEWQVRYVVLFNPIAERGKFCRGNVSLTDTSIAISTSQHGATIVNKQCALAVTPEISFAEQRINLARRIVTIKELS
jgi:hypothetical protein